MSEEKIPEAPRFIPDGLTLVELPEGHWAVVRKALPRGQAQRLREKLWSAGILPGVSTATFNAEQWTAWEEDWAERIVAYTKSWSLRDEGTGEALSVERESIDLMPDPIYQRFCVELRKVERPPTQGEAKSPDSGAERVVQGDGDQRDGSTADVPEGAEDGALVEELRPSLPG
jgi:hypothetical protein